MNDEPLTEDEWDDEPECNGLCSPLSDVGVLGDHPDMVAYAHPDCPLHCPYGPDPH